MISLPQKGYLARMRVYFAEMYPIPSRVLFAVLIYGAIEVFAARATGVSPALASPYLAGGAWNMFSVLLILRLMDELKDQEADRRLFRTRPLPSGRVREADIKFTLAVITVLYGVANLFTSTTALAALVVLGYAGLMYRYFFIPGILTRNLLLNLATHNPIIPLIVLHGFVFFSAIHNLSLSAIDWTLVVAFTAMVWAACFAWEIARKIRLP